MIAIPNKTISDFGYVRVGAAVPSVSPADVELNKRSIIAAIDEARKHGVQILVLPELCVTGYTCSDLFHQSTLLRNAYRALYEIAAATEGQKMLVAVGAPIVYRDLLYNCAVLINDGRIAGVVPKTYVPNYGEFYEQRWFASGAGVSGSFIGVDGRETPFGTDLLFYFGGTRIGVELCEDLWAPTPPSTALALAGAQVILNLSASNEVIGKHDYLVDLLRQQSARLHAGYVYASAGYGESSTDLVFAGNGIIAENGTLLASTPRFTASPQMAVADLDCDLLMRERRYNTTWRESSRLQQTDFRRIVLSSDIGPEVKELKRLIGTAPFVPQDKDSRHLRSAEIVAMQVAGLKRRLEATRCTKLIVGVSGGLDSTLALLVAHRAFVEMKLDVAGIIGITMPGFGTTGRTYNNATELIRSLGATLKEISIVDSVRQHFRDIGQDESVHDVTYENGQARERTQILMDFANKVGGMVLGTGDLSELALGWCTYNGDHMSMYGVNASVPKTLVKHLVEYFADVTTDTHLAAILRDIVDTPISPELLPATATGDIKQKTEDLVGPYKLHDFVLYHVLRFGFDPEKIYMLAVRAFDGEFEPAVIKHWMQVFYRRFFNQQFKRSCMPDGPKIGSVCLSPRGDWRMPSDASAALWLQQCENL